MTTPAHSPEPNLPQEGAAVERHRSDTWPRLTVILLVWLGASLLLFFATVGTPDEYGTYVGWLWACRPGWVWMGVSAWLCASWTLWAFMWVMAISQPATYRSLIAWALVLCGSIGSVVPLIY